MTQLPTYVTEEILADIRSNIIACAPNESCGLIVRKLNGDIAFMPVVNTHASPSDHFTIDARIVAELNVKNIAILAVVHNHPKGSADPSDHDIVSMNVHKKPFLIVGMDGDVSWTLPTRTPLVGRPFIHGHQDCYSLVRDYYSRELGIMLPNYDRTDRWWESSAHPALYVNNYEDAGFVRVSKRDIRRHDVMLCRWGNTAHVNHAMIFLGDDGSLLSEETNECVGSRLALHHLCDHVSNRFLLGESRMDTIEHVVRHKAFM